MTDWLSYVWDLDGRSAEFRVDLQYWSLLSSLAYTKRIRVSCTPKDLTESGFSHKELRLLAALEADLEGGLTGNAVMVGGIRLPALAQYYCYTDSNEVIAAIRKLCREQTQISARCDVAGDPFYSDYYCLLFPDDRKLQSVENAAYIAGVVKRGGDTELVRRVILTFAFLERSGREGFIREVPDAGLSVMDSFERVEASHPCCVRTNGFSQLTLKKLNEFTGRGIGVAVRHGGMLTELNAEFIKSH